MKPFQVVLDRAIERKGGEISLQRLLPADVDKAFLASLPDYFFLAEMSRSIFQSGFVWRVINDKWPQINDAFLEFKPERLMGLTQNQWEDYINDTRIVRHRQKIAAIRHNVWYVHETSVRYGSFGKFIAEWPESDLVGLFQHLKKHGSRLGGNTGQYFLQHVGKDSFALTKDVVACLKLQGLEISDNPSSQKDLGKIQQAINNWHAETGLPYYHLSIIMANSVGENRPVET